MAKFGLLPLVRSVAQSRGYDVVKARTKVPIPLDFDKSTSGVIPKVVPYTMMSIEKLGAVCDAASYVAANKIPGDIVECGVWRGGGMMACAYLMLEAGQTDRHIYLFDTFEGLPKPTNEDVTYDGREATAMHVPMGEIGSDWCRAELDEVTANMRRTGYPEDKIHFVKGMVEETIPDNAPETIALLHLDTDWYTSTKHEMLHLFPRISVGGVLIIDDYGDWMGARKAVDEYVAANNVTMFLARVDGSRVGVKLK